MSMNIEELRENLESAIKVGACHKTNYTNAVAQSNKKIPMLLAEFGLKKDMYNIITLDMTMELAEMLHISTEEAYSILIAVSNLIEKRTMEGKISVIDNLIMLYTRPQLVRRRIKGKPTKTILRMIVTSTFRKNINKQFIPPWSDNNPRYQLNKKEKKIIVDGILDKISEKRRINFLLADLFGRRRPDAID